MEQCKLILGGDKAYSSDSEGSLSTDDSVLLSCDENEGESGESGSEVNITLPVLETFSANDTDSNEVRSKMLESFFPNNQTGDSFIKLGNVCTSNNRIILRLFRIFQFHFFKKSTNSYFFPFRRPLH